MPHPGLQRKRAAAALSEAGRAGPISHMRHPAGRPHMCPSIGCTRQTSDRQTSDNIALCPLVEGISCVGGSHNMPHPQQVDLLTLKVVSESRVTWPTSVPILVFLGLCVRLTPNVHDRQTSDAHHRLVPLDHTLRFNGHFSR